MKTAKDQLAFPDVGHSWTIDYSIESPAGRGSCIEKEHRNGVCPDGHKHEAIEERHDPNTVMNVLRTSVIDQLTGTGTPDDLLITMIGCGTSADANDVTDTLLTTEYYRAAPTDLIKTGPTTLSVFWFFGTGVANSVSDLQEWGIFADGATSTANTGKLVARFLQQFNKTATKTVSGQYDLSLT